MYLHDNNISCNIKYDNTNYKTYYSYRVDQLLEWMTQLFTWSGLPDSIPDHVPDLYLYLYGKCGFNYISDSEKKLLCVAVQQFGPTDYITEYSDYSWATPLHNGQQKINVNGILATNTKLHQSAWQLIHATASKLAHSDVTYICGNVNGRSTTAVKAASQKFFNDAVEFERRRYNGEHSIAVDKAFSALEFEDMHTNNNINLRELIDTQQLILAEFWECLGVKKLYEKRERMTAGESNSNANLLHLNIQNMYDSRVKAAESINKMFGTNITVKCNVDLDNNPDTSNSDTIISGGDTDA